MIARRCSSVYNNLLNIQLFEWLGSVISDNLVQTESKRSFVINQ